LANYYCQFIERFALIAKPLHNLVKKDQKWNWTERQEKAFRELKEQFIKELVLVAPDLDKRMRMEVDASDYATGGVLSMECEDGLWRLVAFLSKSLNETKRNYEIYDKEMLAIIKVQKLNCRQAQWALYLSRFDFILKHVLGTKMGKVDRLSRQLD